MPSFGKPRFNPSSKTHALHSFLAEAECSSNVLTAHEISPETPRDPKPTDRRRLGFPAPGSLSPLRPPRSIPKPRHRSGTMFLSWFTKKDSEEDPPICRSGTIVLTDAAAMTVVRAARPALRGAHDGVAFAAHAAFFAAGYSLCAVGPAALADPSPSGDEEVGIDGWNSMENCYAFLYSKKEKGKKKRVLVKCLVIGEVLAIDVLDLKAQDKGPYNIQINVKDFFVKEQPKNYGDMYKNFASLIETVSSNVLCKLDGDYAAAVAAKKAAVLAARRDAAVAAAMSIDDDEISSVQRPLRLQRPRNARLLH